MRNFPFTIGADPEFNVVSQGRKVDAQYTMRKLLEKDSKFDSDIGLELGAAGNIGWDGNSSTGEMRPSPANNAKELAENIGKLFKGYAERINLFDLSTLSFYSSVGGHLHFQLPKTDVSDTIIRKYHKQLASFYMPIMMSENKINLELRTRGGYGGINDFHGDNFFGRGDSRVRTYEFRTPSAEWITTPKVAEATIAYLGTVWNEIINHPRNIAKCNDMIFKTEKQGVALQELMMSEYTLLTQGIFNDIKKNIKTFEFYKDYKDQIDYILNPEKVMKDKMNVNYNIIEGWGLDAKKDFTKRDLNSDKKFQERAKDIDLDTHRTLINITYNSDPQCEMFANEISSRAAAFKWKLKKTYFLFGLRKDIGTVIATDMASGIYAGAIKVQTHQDKDTFITLFQRMGNKFRSNNSRGPIRLDFNTGKLIKEDADTILIGIPYELRMARNIDPIISLIYDIENGTTKPKPYSEMQTTDTENGELYSIMNRTVPEVAFAQEDRRVTAGIEDIMIRMAQASSDAVLEGEEIPPVNTVVHNGITMPSREHYLGRSVSSNKHSND